MRALLKERVKVTVSLEGNIFKGGLIPIGMRSLAQLLDDQIGNFIPNFSHVNLVQTSLPLSNEEITRFDHLVDTMARNPQSEAMFARLWDYAYGLLKERGSKRFSLLTTRWSFYQSLDNPGENEWGTSGESLRMAYHSTILEEGMHICRLRDMEFVKLNLFRGLLGVFAMKGDFVIRDTSYQPKQVVYPIGSLSKLVADIFPDNF